MGERQRMREVTVLVSAAGSTNGVNVIKALRDQNEYGVKIVAIDSDSDAAGLYLADEHEIAPEVSAPAFQDFILDICRKYSVNIIMPTHSAELPLYSSNQRLLNDQGARLMVSPSEKIEICDDKLKLAEYLHKLGVRQPRIYNQTGLDDIREDDFPLFIKSRFGSGSAHAHRISAPDELSFYLRKVPAPIVQECIEGKEYTVNVISDYDGKVIGLLPLRRVKVKGGLAVVAKVEINSAIMEGSKRVVEALGLIGPSNIQVMTRNGELIFLEVNPRFASGGLPLAVSAGLNIPLLMIKLMQGEPIEKLKIQDGKTMIRYWDFLIID